MQPRPYMVGGDGGGVSPTSCHALTHQVCDHNVGSNVFLFGLPGVGKTYVGHVLERHLGYKFLEGDQWLPADLRESLDRGLGFTQEQRDRFAAVIADEIGKARDQVEVESLRLGIEDRPLVIAQAVFKRRHRDVIRSAHPDMVFCWVRADEGTRMHRLASRGDVVTAELGRRMAQDFEPPGEDEQTIALHNEGAEGCDAELVEHLRRVLAPLRQSLEVLAAPLATPYGAKGVGGLDASEPVTASATAVTRETNIQVIL
eukprot:TRINITY_DN45534_c0_g1_i1.p1 TRINITY_DN45534_c0_g1~~TRINITY_DN45534_c0_g1_i1.p1  ORF type:complete len:258 (+),score=35.25 TRINITY_DN45534_c0_g1_i1:219-992(+)